MVFILILIFQCYGLNYDDVLVLFSEKTDSKLLKHFVWFNQQFSVNDFKFADHSSFSLIVDITDSPQYLKLLDELSEYYQVKYITITPKLGSSYSDRRLHALPNPSYQGKKMADVIRYLNWTSLTIISFNSYSDIEYLDSLKLSIDIPYSYYFLQENTDKVFLDAIVKRAVKASGQKNFVIIGSGEQIMLLQEALIYRKAAKSGQSIIFPSFAANRVFMENSMILALPGTQETSDYANDIYSYLTYLIDIFLDKPLIEFLKKCPMNDCFGDFEILKVKDGKKIVVGKIENDLIVGDIKELGSGISSEKTGC